MKKVFFAVLLCFSVISTAMSQRVLMVTEVHELEAEGGGYISDYLRSQGFTVDMDQGTTPMSEFAGELSDEKVARLNSYDVVIVHRQITSGNFNSPTIALRWNEDVTAPILLGSAYLVRNSRWIWIDSAQQRTNLWTGVDIVDPNHPVAAGLTGEFFDVPLGIDHAAPGDVGQGKIIATILNSASADAPAIVAWEPGQEFAAAGAYVAGGARLFLPFYRYHEHADLGFGSAASDPADGSFENYTENGLALIKQGVEWLATFSNATDVDTWELY